MNGASNSHVYRITLGRIKEDLWLVYLMEYA